MANYYLHCPMHSETTAVQLRGDCFKGTVGYCCRAVDYEAHALLSQRKEERKSKKINDFVYLTGQGNSQGIR